MKHTFNKMLASSSIIAGSLLLATVLSAQAPAGGAPAGGAAPGGADGGSAGLVGAAARSARSEPEALAADIGRVGGGRTREVPDAARMEFLRRRAGRPVRREIGRAHV